MGETSFDLNFSGYAEPPSGGGGLFRYLTDTFGTNIATTEDPQYPITKPRTFRQLSVTTLDPVPPNESINVSLLQNGGSVAILPILGGAIGIPAGTVLGPIFFVAPYASGDRYSLQTFSSNGIIGPHGLSATLTT